MVSAAKTSKRPFVPSVEPELVNVYAGTSLDRAEQLLIEATLRYTSGNVSQAAKMLGLDRSTLHIKLKRYGIKG
jgi:DNA-binding protein Fis